MALNILFMKFVQGNGLRVMFHLQILILHLLAIQFYVAWRKCIEHSQCVYTSSKRKLCMLCIINHPCSVFNITFPYETKAYYVLVLIVRRKTINYSFESSIEDKLIFYLLTFCLSGMTHLGYWILSGIWLFNMYKSFYQLG